jgi:hypothetical protein
LLDAVRRGDLAPPVGAALPLDQFREALSLAASREGLGKTIVTIGE